jgi:phage protein D
MPSTVLVEVDGTPLAAGQLDALIEVSAEEATGEADAVTLTARTDATAAGEWVSPLDPLVVPRTPVVVEVARDGVSYRFEGTSAEAVWEIDAERGSRLTVKAIDAAADLDAEERVVAWPGTSDSAIAEAVFAGYGITPQVEATPPAADADVHVAIQRGTDWAFLRALAAKWGYELYVEVEAGLVVGHFHPVDPLAAPQGTLALGFGPAAVRARAEVQLTGGRQVTATRTPVLSDAAQTATDDGTEQAQGADPLGGQTGVLLAPTDLFGEVEPDAAARSLARAGAYGVTLSVDLDTDVAGLLLRARRTVEVAGLGSVLSGLYLVDRVRHVVTTAAHRQQGTLRRNALGGS